MSFSTGSMHPTDNHFSALSFPVLTDRIFLYPAFTHRISSIYSNIIAPTVYSNFFRKLKFLSYFNDVPLQTLPGEGIFRLSCLI